MKRQRRDQAAARQEKRATVQRAIRMLRLRGFTKGEVCRLATVSRTSVNAWAAGKRTPQRPVVQRFLVLVRETAHLAADVEPGRGHRWTPPHPEFDALLARCRPKILRFRVKDTWKDRRAG